MQNPQLFEEMEAAILVLSPLELYLAAPLQWKYLTKRKLFHKVMPFRFRIVQLLLMRFLNDLWVHILSIEEMDAKAAVKALRVIRRLTLSSAP